MKLWIAKNVLCDWTCGIMLVHAKNENDAIDQLIKHDLFHYWCLVNPKECECHKDIKMDLSKKWIKYHKPTRLPNEFEEIKGGYALGVSGGS